MELGVHAGEWSALPCGSAAPPAERDYPLEKGGKNTHTPHTEIYASTQSSACSPVEAAAANTEMSSRQ
jgi:hypothetical protein